MFTIVFTLSALSILSGVAVGTHLQGCGALLSNECANFILQDPQGPQMMPLAMELAKSDPPNAQKAQLRCNGQSFDLSPAKWKLANHAMQNGLPEQALANMLEKSGQPKSNIPNPRFPPGKSSQRSLSVGGPHPKPVRSATPLIPCSMVCTRNGEMNLRVGNIQLPMEEMSKLGHFMDAKTVKQMAATLRSAGIPVIQHGNYMTMVPSDNLGPENDMLMRIYAVNEVPVRMELDAGGRSFQLPGQEHSLNSMLSSNPDMAFPMMKLLAHHGIPAEFDCNQRTLTTALSPKSSPETPKAPPHPTPAVPPPAPPPRHPAPPPMVRPPPSKAAPVTIGSSTFDLPTQWPSVLNAVQSNQIPAARVQKIAEEHGFTMPDNMQNIIFTKIMQMRDQLMPVIRGDDCIFAMDGNPFSMLTQAEELSNVLREADVPRQLVRDSLMRAGLPAKDTPNGLQVTLPSQQTCVLDNMPTYKIFEYKISKERDSVTVTAGPNSYRLPENVLDLKRAMDSGKVLPLELMDSLNRNGIPCNVDMASGTMTMSLPRQHVSMPLPMANKTGKLKLHPLEGPLGTSYMLEYEGGRLHLPSQIDKLNQLIADGRLNSYDVLHLFLQNTLVPYQFDKARKLHVVEIAGQKLKILSSSLV